MRLTCKEHGDEFMNNDFMDGPYCNACGVREYTFAALRAAFASLGDAIRFQANLACCLPWCGCEIARDTEDPFVCETARMVYEKVPDVFAHGARRTGGGT